YVADNLTDKEESALYSNKEERSRVRTILANALFIIAMGHYNNAYKIYSEMSALPDDAGDDRKKALKAKLQAALIDGNESFMFLPDGELKSNIKTLMKEAGLEDKDFENIAPEKIEKLIKDMCDGLARSVDVRDFYAKFYPNQDPNFTNAQYAERLNELEDYLREGSAYLTPEFYDKTREELDDLMARINPAYAAERMLSVKTLPQKLDFYFITMLKDVDYKLFWRTMKTKTFIVINDNKEQADWFVERLYPKSAGAILRFNTAAEALDAIKKLPNKKDIIVYTYIVMEKGSGLDLLKEAKEISEDIMVVAASAGVNDDNRMTLIRNGFDGAVGFEEYSATTNVLYYLILYGSMKNINISEDPQIVKDMVKFFLTPGWENKPIEEIERQFSVFNNSYSFDDWVEGETFSKIIAVRPTRPLALHYYKLLHDLYDKEMARGFNIVDKKAGDELSYLSHELWGDAFALRKTDPDLNKQANKLIAEADKLIKKRYNLKDKSTAGTVNMRFDFGLVDFIAKIIKKRFDSKKNAPVETAAAPYEKAVQKAAQSVPQSAAQSAPSVAKAIPVIDGKTIFIFDKNGTLTARKEAMTEDFAAWFLDFIKKHKTYIVSGANWKTLSAELPPDILGNLAGVYASLGNEFYDSSGKLANSNRFNPPIELFYMLQSFYRTTRYPGRLSDDPYKMEPGVLKFSVVMRGLPAEERAAYRRWDAERGERLMWKKQIEDKFPELQVVLGASIGMDIVPRGLGKERVLNELRADNEGAQIIYFGDEIESGNDKTISQMLDGGDKGYAFNVTGPEDTKKQITALLAAQPATAADAEAAKSGVVEENKKADADNLEILGRMVRNTWKAKDANTETSYAVKVALDGSLDEVETLKALEGFDKEYKPAYIEFVHAKFVETDSVTLGKKILKYESARGAV
ncbi:MAG: hypothetical protein FWC57_00280, partial [Endomicrobia bacterium]|nr:hypothetical protein [Endomicrobiia bacterium]